MNIVARSYIYAQKGINFSEKKNAILSDFSGVKGVTFVVVAEDWLFQTNSSAFFPVTKKHKKRYINLFQINVICFV